MDGAVFRVPRRLNAAIKTRLTNTEPAAMNFLAQVAFRKVDKQNLAIVHNFLHVKGILCLSDDIAHHTVCDKRADLVQRGADQLVAIFRLLGKVIPKLRQDGSSIRLTARSR